MGKFYIFKSAVDAGMYLPAAVGLLMSVVAAFYYLRIVVQMYLREPAPHAVLSTPFSPPEAMAIALASAGTLYIGLFPSRLFDLARLVL
jgi:NADH-quinone oxidoreductase subunit N